MKNTFYPFILVIWIGIFYLFFGGGSGHPVNRAMFNKEWPFTIDEASIRCKTSLTPFVVHNNTWYPLNGTAMAYAKQYPQQEYFEAIEKIWAVNEQMKKELLAAGAKDDGNWPRISVSTLLNYGLEKCKAR